MKKKFQFWGTPTFVLPNLFLLSLLGDFSLWLFTSQARMCMQYTGWWWFGIPVHHNSFSKPLLIAWLPEFCMLTKFEFLIRIPRCDCLVSEVQHFNQCLPEFQSEIIVYLFFYNEFQISEFFYAFLYSYCEVRE